MKSIKDIKRIGHTAYHDENQMTCIVCDSNTANIEYLLLRDILEGFYNYKILEEKDGPYPNTMEFVTDMPWEQYSELKLKEIK